MHANLELVEVTLEVDAVSVELWHTPQGATGLGCAQRVRLPVARAEAGLLQGKAVLRSSSSIDLTFSLSHVSLIDVGARPDGGPCEVVARTLPLQEEMPKGTALASAASAGEGSRFCIVELSTHNSTSPDYEGSDMVCKVLSAV